MTCFGTNISTVLLFVIFLVFTVIGRPKCSEFGLNALRHFGQCQSDCLADAAALVPECARYPHSGGNSRVTTGASSECVITPCTKNEGLVHNHNEHGIGHTACNTVKGVTIVCDGIPLYDDECLLHACENGPIGLCYQNPVGFHHVLLWNDNGPGPGRGANACMHVNRANRVYAFDKWVMCEAPGNSDLYPLVWTTICTGFAQAVDSNYGQDYHQLRIMDDDDNYVDAYAEENDVSFNEYKTFANMLRLEREQSYWRRYEHGILAKEHRTQNGF